jgi:hypothetical protein
MHPVGAKAWIEKHRREMEENVAGVLEDVQEPGLPFMVSAATLSIAHQNTYIIELLEQILLAVSKA